MKRFVLAVGLLAAAAAGLNAFEGGADKKEEMFSAHKQSILKNLDIRIELLQRSRDCIKAAENHEALKLCRQQEETAMRALHQTKKQGQLRMIEEQQRKLERRKQELIKGEEGHKPK